MQQVAPHVNTYGWLGIRLQDVDYPKGFTCGSERCTHTRREDVEKKYNNNMRESNWIFTRWIGLQHGWLGDEGRRAVAPKPPHFQGRIIPSQLSGWRSLGFGTGIMELSMKILFNGVAGASNHLWAYGMREATLGIYTYKLARMQTAMFGT